MSLEPRYRLLGVVPREVEQQKDEQAPDDSVFTWPHFLIRHAVVAGGVVVVVFVLAILFQAPLKDIANPSQTPDGREGAVVLRRVAGAACTGSQPVVAGVLIPGAALLWLVRASRTSTGARAGGSATGSSS